MTGGINYDTSPHYFGSVSFGSLNKNIEVHNVNVGKYYTFPAESRRR